MFRVDVSLGEEWRHLGKKEEDTGYRLDELTCQNAEEKRRKRHFYTGKKNPKIVNGFVFLH